MKERLLRMILYILGGIWSGLMGACFQSPWVAAIAGIISIIFLTKNFD